MDAAIERALDPEIFIIPIPPRPPGVAMAAIVEFIILLKAEQLVQLLPLRIIFFRENHKFSHIPLSPTFSSNTMIIL